MPPRNPKILGHFSSFVIIGWFLQTKYLLWIFVMTGLLAQIRHDLNKFLLILIS